MGAEEAVKGGAAAAAVAGAGGGGSGNGAGAGAGGSAAGAAGGGGAAAAAGAGGAARVAQGGGDVRVALKHERELRRAAEARLRELLPRVSGSAAAGGGGGGSGAMDPELSLTAEDLEAGDPARLTAKVARMVDAGVERRLAQLRVEQESVESARADVQELFGRFEIFSDQDPGIRREAIAAVTGKMAELGARNTRPTLAEIEAAFEETAQAMSRRVAERDAAAVRAGRGGEDVGAVPLGGGGSAEAAHLTPSPADVSKLSRHQVGELASKVAQAFWRKRAAAGS